MVEAGIQSFKSPKKCLEFNSIFRTSLYLIVALYVKPVPLTLMHSLTKSGIDWKSNISIMKLRAE